MPYAVIDPTQALDSEYKVILYLRFALRAMTTPIKNPPMCAHTATPPFTVRPKVLIQLRNCMRNHRPNTITAGTRTTKMKIKVRMRLCGSKTM